MLIDDSIVRGNTIGPLVKLLRKVGAAEVHVRVASPPLHYPCYMGINIPTKEELIANSLDYADIANHVGKLTTPNPSCPLLKHLFQVPTAWSILAWKGFSKPLIEILSRTRVKLVIALHA